MEYIDESLFKKFYLGGVVTLVTVYVQGDSLCYLYYKLNNGDTGVVNTKRGKSKGYRFETAFQFLRALGILSVRVDMSLWVAPKVVLL